MNFRKEMSIYSSSDNISFYHTQKLAIISQYENSECLSRKAKKRIRKSLREYWVKLSAMEIMVHGCWQSIHNLPNTGILTSLIPNIYPPR